MKVLAHGVAVDGGSRLALALAGLSLRGHEVWASPAARGVAGGRRADIVVGDGNGPLGVALAGRLAGAGVMLLDLSAAAIDRWRWPDRWAWQWLHSVGLVADSDAPELGANPRGLERERLGLWPAAPPPGRPDPAHPDTEVLERACERALARYAGGAVRPAVFLDRDGTLVRETGYLSNPDALELLPGVGRALRNLSESGYPLVVVSNQSGVGRGMFGAADVHRVMARLRERLREHGVELAAVYFCPHRPDEECACRKPRPGLLLRAADDLKLDLGGSLMIGDKRIDAAAGRNAGASGILVRSGYGREEELRVGEVEPAPDVVCDDVADAVAWWLGPG